MSKFVPIQLDKMRNFRYGMRALSVIEALTGKPISKIDYEALTMKELAIIVYAGLMHEDKDLTPDKVMDLIDEYSDITTVSEKMSKAMEQAFGKNVQGAAANGK